MKTDTLTRGINAGKALCGSRVQRSAKVAVIGAGGHAKVIISTLRATGHSIGAVFDDDASLWGTEILNVTVRGPIAIAGQAEFELGIIAIGDNIARREIARSLKLHWLTLVHPAAWVDPEARLGPGTVVFAGAVVQLGSVLGAHVIVNTSASVDHDCIVRDFVHLAPGVHLAGDVHIGEGAFMGIGSAATPARKIGAWTTVGAGAVVVRNIPADVVAYGVPAKPMRELGPRSVPGCRILTTEQEEEWMEVLGRVTQHDFYHLPQYHRVEESRLKATAHLFTYCEGDYLVALPLLLRPAEAGLTQWNDATSVYGYGGPVASHRSPPEQVVRNFHAALKTAMAERDVVAVFSRLHPVIQQENLLVGLGEYCANGQTVSIDLTQPPEKQVAQYRRDTRQRIAKHRREGVIVCLHDQEKRYLGEFVSIYEKTMRRVKAEQSYFFGEDHFRQLSRELGSVLHLFVAMIGDKVAAASLFTLCSGVVQYHLGGTRDEFIKLSPTALILDTVRLWASELGARVLHLGGGIGGAKDDSLFHFKAGFSNQRHSIGTWRWVVDPEIYRKLCERQARINGLQGLECASSIYFPDYRCLTVPRGLLKLNGAEDKGTEPWIYLSPPHLGEAELELVKDAFASNWIAPMGPHVDAFEHEFAEYLGVPYAAALSSGTAAIHLALRLLGLEAGDEVLCSTLTFVASANPILYEGGTPVFIDSEAASWNMDPELLRQELEECAGRGRLPRAVVVVDLYGQSADYDPILEACARYQVPVIQDSAEALGGSYKGRKAGTQGRCGIFSFNGNKIITTSGGGMLVSEDRELIERARFLATQARDPAPHYEHSSVGFNYRMSNVLAAIGRGQLQVLDERVAARRRNFERYKAALGSVPGIEFMRLASYGEPNFWLTCIMIDPEKFGATREQVRVALASRNIDARPVWKPLHLQPLFAHCRARGGTVAEAVFKSGLCLPSGSNLTDAQFDRVCAVLLGAGANNEASLGRRITIC